jgi:hypothetical protein
MVRVQPDELLGFHRELAPGGEEFAESLGDLPRTVTDEIVTGKLAHIASTSGARSPALARKFPFAHSEKAP